MRWAALRSALLVPIVVVALLGAVLGFIVTRQLAPQGASDAARVSVIALASTPTPEPTPQPSRQASPAPDEEDGRASSSGRGGGNRGRGNCPAGCTCESRPPSGVLIVCRGS